MSKIFITGSSNGLGLLTAKALIENGHEVVLHARNQERAAETLEKLAHAQKVLIADLSDLEETKELALQVNALGRFDAIIHNAGIYNVSGNTKDGIPLLFAVNSLAPYILSCLIEKPKRLIYLSSNMHHSANPTLSNLSSDSIRGQISYSDTKFHNLVLSMALADKWKDVFVNALHPGWVPTRMGGAGAPDSLEKGIETQAWLAVSNEPETLVSGQYFYHKKKTSYLKEAKDKAVQDKFISFCEYLSKIKLPDSYF